MEARAREIEEHVAECADCQRSLDSLQTVDQILDSLPPAAPSAATLLNVRRALARETRPGGSEIMTLSEVAELLRIPEADLDEVIEELPAFELGGRVRVRRSKLVEWIEQREQNFTKARMESYVARSLADGIKESVA